MADIPIPFSTAEAFQRTTQYRNLGLLFDRYIGYQTGWKMEGSHKFDEATTLVGLANSWRRQASHGKLYDGLDGRQVATFKAVGAESFVSSPEWRLVVGLGRDSPLEVGLTLHRVYGCPYVPGSALKGMTKAWAEAMFGEDEDKKEEISRVFGEPDKAGEAVFYDALPTAPPRYEVDIMNPHYPDYYREGKREVPAGWQSPTPVYFITVAGGSRFRFAVGSRTRNSDMANTAQEWLKEALQDMGVGGKTTSGYGFWNLK